MMRPDLKSCSIEEMHFTAVDVPLTDDLVAEIRNASPPDDEGDSLFTDRYMANSVRHSIWAWVLENREDARTFELQFHCDLVVKKRLKSAPTPSLLVGILRRFQEEVEMECAVSFAFGRRQKVRPIVPLPTRVLDLPDMPFDEIDGLHLVKRGDGRLKYEVALAVQRSGNLRMIVSFPYRGMMNEGLADDVMRQASQICERFIWRKS